MAIGIQESFLPAKPKVGHRDLRSESSARNFLALPRLAELAASIARHPQTIF
jgi:hypothetical protein